MVTKSTEGKNGQIGSGAFPRDVDYAMPNAEVLQLALNAAKPFEGYKQSPDIIEAAKAIGAQHAPRITEEDIALIEAQVAAVCGAAMVSPTEINKVIVDLKANVGCPRSQLSEIRQAALTAADRALKEAVTDRAESADMHKSFYANDAIYRAKVDAIMGEATTLMNDAEKRRAASDEVAGKHGIHTDHDAEMEDLAKRYKLLDPTSLEARALEARMLRVEGLQNDARIEQLEQGGHHAEADTLKKNKPPIEDASKKIGQLYAEQRDAYLEALTRKLVLEGELTPKQIKEYTEKERTSLDTKFQSRARPDALLKDMEDNILKEKEAVAKLEQPKHEAPLAKTKLQEIVPETYIMAEANFNKIEVPPTPDRSTKKPDIVGL